MTQIANKLTNILYSLLTLPWSHDYCKSISTSTRLIELWYNIIYSPDVVAIYNIQQQASYIKQTHKDTGEVIWNTYDDRGIHIIPADSELVSNWLTATIDKSICPRNIITEFDIQNIDLINIKHHYFLYRQYHITCIRLFQLLGQEYEYSLHRSSLCNCIEHQTLA